MDLDQMRDWLSRRPPQREPLVMGVLNVTPDSFSDGGSIFHDAAVAAAQAQEMVNAGADLIDIGGESTRPGSQPVDPQEQVRRVVPVIRALRERSPAVISVDTTRSEVAEAALDAGANVINDISAGRDDPRLLALAASRKAPLVLMHMQGTPATMQVAPRYADVVREVIEFLGDRIGAAVNAGNRPRDLLIDPGIGFGKTLRHNLELLRRLSDLATLGRPIVVGTSRKGFIGKIIGEADPLKRMYGTAATVAWTIAQGADIVRVHEVGPMKQVVRMTCAILRDDEPE